MCVLKFISEKMSGPREGSFLETLCFMNQLPSFRFVKLTPPECRDTPQHGQQLTKAGSPGAHFVDQAGLELRNSPASASQVLGLKACATMPGMFLVLFLFLILYILTHTTILKIAC